MIEPIVRSAMAASDRKHAGASSMVEAERMRHYARSFKEAICLFVGRGRLVPVEALSEATGISSDSINRWRRGENLPDLHSALELARALPAGFAEMAFLAPAGLTGCARLEADDADACPHKALTRLLARAQMLARMLEDGRLDHREQREAKVELRKLAAEINSFVANMPEQA